MVTGTTASSGDHSIITVRVGFPVACWANCARYSVCPGAGKPLSYSTDLATGFVTRPAARPVTTSATAWRIDAIAAGSPRVSAKGADGAANLADLDHGAAPQFVEVPLGLRLVALVGDFLAHLALLRALGARRLLGADREHFDAELGDAGRRQAP